jgi:hypothetical protein
MIDQQKQRETQEHTQAFHTDKVARLKPKKIGVGLILLSAFGLQAEAKHQKPISTRENLQCVPPRECDGRRVSLVFPPLTSAATASILKKLPQDSALKR